MKPPIITALSATLIATFAAVSSYAQVGYTTTTLEGLVADSEVVVRATVAEVERARAPDKSWRETITLKVTEMIRGPKADSVTFARSVHVSDRIFDAWRDAGREHLWFFARNRGFRAPEPGKETDFLSQYPLVLWRVVRLGPPVPAEKGFGPGGQGPWTLPVFTLNMMLVSQPEEILSATRAAAAEWIGRGTPKLQHIDLPRAVMQKSGRSGDANRLDVPIDHHLEKLARRLIVSPGDFISRSDFGTPKDEAHRKNIESWLGFTKDLLRREGIRALAHFRSTENIALIRPLLDDPTYWGLHKKENGRDVLKDGVPIDIGREYYIRQEAYSILQKWDVKVDKPVIEELHPSEGK